MSFCACQLWNLLLRSTRKQKLSAVHAIHYTTRTLFSADLRQEKSSNLKPDFKMVVCPTVSPPQTHPVIKTYKYDSNVSKSQIVISQRRCWQISDSRQSLVQSSTQQANTQARACDTTSYCTAYRVTSMNINMNIMFEGHNTHWQQRDQTGLCQTLQTHF